MKGLLKKDLAIVLCNIKIYLVVALIGIVYSLLTAGPGMPSNFFSVYLIIVLAFAGVGTMSYDDFGGGMGFLMTLPVKRSTYVKEKYIFCFLCILAGWAVSILIGLVVYRGQIMQGEEPFAVSALLFAAAAGILVFVMIPLWLRFGSENSRVIIIAVFAGSAAVVLAGLKLISLVFVNMSDIYQWLAGITGGQLLAGLAGFLAAEFLISYFCSLRIMRKKEF